MKTPQSPLPSKKMDKPEYLNFPIALLKNFAHSQPKRLQDILSCGLFNYAQKIDVSIDDAAKQAIYCMYNYPETDLAKMLSELKNLMDDIGLSEMRGFNVRGQFEPKKELEILYDIFENDPDLKECALNYHRVHLAIMRFRLDVDTEQVITRYHSLHNEICGKQAMGSIKLDVLFEYMNSKKTDSQVMQLLMYIAIRSILGKKRYCRIYFDLIRARMFGFNSSADVDTMTCKNPLYQKYQKRDSFRTVLTHLKLKWKVITAATKTRGLIFSIKNRMTLLELTQIAEATKLKNRIKALQLEEKYARERVKQIHHSAA